MRAAWPYEALHIRPSCRRLSLERDRISASAVIGREPIERQLNVGWPPVKYVRRENSGLTHLSGSFPISATHPLCPLLPDDFPKSGRNNINSVPDDVEFLFSRGRHEVTRNSVKLGIIYNEGVRAGCVSRV